MGIESIVSFGNDCNFCFAPGETPGQIILAFSDIKQGNLWAPGMPGPPNRSYTLTQNVGLACLWDDADAFHTTSIAFTALISRFTFSFSGPFRNVFVKNEGVCKMFAENVFQDPAGRFYYGGKVQAWIV